MYDPSGALKDGFWHVEHQLWSGGKG
nr:TPA: hypothetical protein BN1204_004725 [Neospora caninum Liverpool]